MIDLTTIDIPTETREALEAARVASVDVLAHIDEETQLSIAHALVCQNARQAASIPDEDLLTHIEDDLRTDDNYRLTRDEYCAVFGIYDL